MTKTRRVFMPEFKLEALALLASGIAERSGAVPDRIGNRDGHAIADVVARRSGGGDRPDAA
jgi:hypothetical protein